MLPLFGWAVTNVVGQATAIDGYVTDAETELPIEGATVSIQGYPSVNTDANGYYVIEVAAGTHDVKASIIRYESQTLPVTVVEGQTASQNFTLVPTTKVYVDPPLVTANPGGTFTVNVKIANVEDLYGYQFELGWDPALLEYTGVIEGPFLSSEDTYFTFFVKKPRADHLHIECTLVGEPASAAASGSGTLVIVEFRASASLEPSNCTLNLYGTLFARMNLQEIPHTVEDGYFKYPLSEVGVNPSSIIDTDLIRGRSFNVSISITMAMEVYAWRFNMSWDPTLLNVTDLYEGPFLNPEGMYNTLFTAKLRQEEGYLYANCTLSGAPPEASVSGNGTLIIVTFMVENKGDTALDISEAMLLDYNGVEIQTIIKDGYFTNLSADVAVISVSVSPSKVRAGDCVSISVVAKNDGEIHFGLSVDVAIYYNESFLGTIGIPDVNPGDQKTLSFSWNTKDLAEGNYTIEAVASQVPRETNTANNRYVYKYLMVMPPEQPFPFTLLAFAGAIIVVVIVVLLFKKRR